MSLPPSSFENSDNESNQTPVPEFNSQQLDILQGQCGAQLAAEDVEYSGSCDLPSPFSDAEEEDEEEEQDEEVQEEEEQEEDDESEAIPVGRSRAIEEVGLQLMRGEVPAVNNSEFIVDAALLNRISPQLLRDTLPSDLLQGLVANTYGELQTDLQRFDLDNVESGRESSIIQKVEMLIELLETNNGSASDVVVADWQTQLEELLRYIYLFPIEQKQYGKADMLVEETVKYLPRAMLALTQQQRRGLQQQLGNFIHDMVTHMRLRSDVIEKITSPKLQKLQVLLKDCHELFHALLCGGLYWNEFCHPSVFKLCTIYFRRNVIMLIHRRQIAKYTSLKFLRELWRSTDIDDFNRWLKEDVLGSLGAIRELDADMSKKTMRCALQNIIPLLILAVAETGFSSELVQEQVKKIMRPYTTCSLSDLYVGYFCLSAEGIAEVSEILQNPNIPKQFLLWIAEQWEVWQDFRVATALLRRGVSVSHENPIEAFCRRDVITWTLTQDDICPHLRQAAAVARLVLETNGSNKVGELYSIDFCIRDIQQCICPELFMAAERKLSVGFADILQYNIFCVLPFCSASQIRRLQRGLGSKWDTGDVLYDIVRWHKDIVAHRHSASSLNYFVDKSDMVQLQWVMRELLSPDLLREGICKSLRVDVLLKVAELLSDEPVEGLMETVLALPRNIFIGKKIKDIDIEKIDPLLLAVLCAQSSEYSYCTNDKDKKKLKFQWGCKDAWEEFGWTLISDAMLRPLDVRNGPAIDAGGPKTQLFYEVGRQLKGPGGLLEIHPEDGYLLPRLAMASGSPPSPADMHLLGRAIARNLLTDSECHLDLDLHPALLIILSASDLKDILPAAKKLDVATPNGCTWSWGIASSLLGGSEMVDLVSPRFKWLEGSKMCLQSILGDIAERYAQWMPAMQNIRLGFQAWTKCREIVLTPQYIRKGLCSERVDMRCFMEVLQIKTNIASPHKKEIVDAYRAAFASIFGDWNREQIEELLVFWTGSNSPRLDDPMKPPSLMIRPSGEYTFARTCFYSLEIPLLQMATCHLELVEQLRAILIQALESQRLSEQQGIRFHDE
jgi:hypothetical protein